MVDAAGVGRGSWSSRPQAAADDFLLVVAKEKSPDPLIPAAPHLRVDRLCRIHETICGSSLICYSAPMIKRVILLVVDGLGVGATDDASSYGDTSCHTLAHLAESPGGSVFRRWNRSGLAM